MIDFPTRSPKPTHHPNTTEGDNGAKDEHKGGSPPTWFFGRSGSAGKLPPSTSSSTASLGSSEGGATGPSAGGGGMKRSRSYIDMLNDKLKEEPSTDPRVVSSYLKFIVMLDFLAVATVVPLLPQYFARSVRAWVCLSCIINPWGYFSAYAHTQFIIIVHQH